MEEKRYTARRADGKTYVTVSRVHINCVGEATTIEERMLKPTRQDSPVGFDWGYHGHGPDDLAHAILADHFGGDDLALKKADDYYQDFSDRVIAHRDMREWVLNTMKVDEALGIFRRDDSPAAIVTLQEAPAC